MDEISFYITFFEELQIQALDEFLKFKDFYNEVFFEQYKVKLLELKIQFEKNFDAMLYTETTDFQNKKLKVELIKLKFEEVFTNSNSINSNIESTKSLDNNLKETINFQNEILDKTKIFIDTRLAILTSDSNIDTQINSENKKINFNLSKIQVATLFMLLKYCKILEFKNNINLARIIEQYFTYNHNPIKDIESQFSNVKDCSTKEWNGLQNKLIQLTEITKQDILEEFIKNKG